MQLLGAEHYNTTVYRQSNVLSQISHHHYPKHKMFLEKLFRTLSNVPAIVQTYLMMTVMIRRLSRWTGKRLRTVTA